MTSRLKVLLAVVGDPIHVMAFRRTRYITVIHFCCLQLRVSEAAFGIVFAFRVSFFP